MKKEEVIKFDAHNFRKHSEDNKRMIRKSLEECGAGRSVVIDNEGELIAGNGVYEQAQALGIPTRVVETDGSELVVVKRTDLATDDEKRKRLAFADNATADRVEWDFGTLGESIDASTLADFNVYVPDIEADADMDALFEQAANAKQKEKPCEIKVQLTKEQEPQREEIAQYIRECLEQYEGVKVV